MKEKLIKVYIDRLGKETLQKILESDLSEKLTESFLKESMVKKILQKTKKENANIAPIILKYFHCYHQHIFIYEAKKRINISKLKKRTNALKFPGYKGDELIYASCVCQNESINILFYVPFKISYHIFSEGKEERRFDTLHTPVLVKISSKGVLISIMTIRKDDWSRFLPRYVIDSRSLYRDDKILELTRSFITAQISKFEFKEVDFTAIAKKLVQMDEVDLYSVTRIKRCETTDRSLLDAEGERKTLKKIAKNKVEEIDTANIITNLDLIILKDISGLPKNSRMILYPHIGCIKIFWHNEGNYLNGIQNKLLPKKNTQK